MLTRPTGRRRSAQLGDFTLTPRVLWISAWALLVGLCAACAAFALLRLIGLVTNLVFYHRWNFSLVAPGGGNDPWWLVLFAPVAGGLVIGLMARYGSEKIRGHGMPEAIESILTGESIVAPRVAILKPISAAISIGTGGPFGAEGPIIMTGGAIGSILSQVLHFTADERKVLLVSGAAAGMAATFNSPLAAVLLAVELLLFEWRPRSLIPVVASVIAATVLRSFLLGAGPVFPVNTAGLHLSVTVDALAAVVGVSGGLLAVAATWLVYRSEDIFARLRVHWMWWPAIGGMVIGAGGLIEPRALGVGYDVIDELLTGRAALSLIVGILVVKTLIWSLSLGSGTSGGVLAPVFMIGGSLGALEGLAFPHVIPGFWAMLGLAAVVGGVMRSPLTGVIFTLELTHAWGAMIPLLVASTAAFALSCLVLKRSVLTEKIARHGLHLTREYSIDPLETFFADEVMRADPVTLPADRPLTREVIDALPDVAHDSDEQWLIPVIDDDGTLVGLTTRRQLSTGLRNRAALIANASTPPKFTVGPNDTLKHVVQLFADHRVSSAPVILPHRGGGQHGVVGTINMTHLMHARRHDLNEDRVRERKLLIKRNTPKPGSG